MLGTIGSSSLAGFSGLSGAGRSTAGLDAQLARYQAALADWVNCPSCKSAEGQAKISELEDKISEVRQRQKAAETGGQRSRPLDDVPPKAAGADASGAIGSRLNVFA